MKEEPTTTTGPADTAGITILPSHQALAARLADGQVAGTNAMADVIALLDSLARQRADEDAVFPVGDLARISALLHGRHGRRTLQRILRLLMQEGILDRRLPVDCAQPVYVLDVAALMRRIRKAPRPKSSRASDEPEYYSPPSA
jgi:hypothetical protein